MLTGTVIHLAHRQHRLRRNVPKIWGNARCKHNICAAWAFTRRANGVTQDGAKVAGGTFLKWQKERRLKSGASSQRTYIWNVASAMLTSQRSQWSDRSPSSHGHSAQVLEQCWNRRGKSAQFCVHQAWCVRCSMHFRAGHQCVLILPHRWCRCYTESQGGMQIHLRLEAFYNWVNLNSESKLGFSFRLNPVATRTPVSWVLLQEGSKIKATFGSSYSFSKVYIRCMWPFVSLRV